MTPTDQDPTTRRAAAIRYRNPALILDLLGRLDVEDRRRSTLVAALAQDHEITEATITKTISDLIDLGAVRLIAARLSASDHRLRITVLGRAWLLGQVRADWIPTFEIEVEDPGLSVRWKDVHEEELR